MHSTIIEGVAYRRYDHLYLVSRDGRFLRGGRPWQPWLRPDGYLSVGRHRLAHRMVATCWCERRDGAGHVHHINGDRGDNRAENLEWVSPKEHIGERHEGPLRGRRLTAEQKERLRAVRLGKSTSAATRQKQREANLRLGIRPPRRPIGTKLGAESRIKISQNSRKNIPCVVRGVVYRSFTEAGKALGERPHSLRKRCLSKRFPDYRVEGPSEGEGASHDGPLLNRG